MTEPLIVLSGRHGRSFELFNQDGDRLGSAVRARWTKSYELRDTQDQVVVRVTDVGASWPVLGLKKWLYEIELPDQASPISITRLSRLSDTASITEGDLELGMIRPPVARSRVDTWLAALGIRVAEQSPALVMDDAGSRTVGRIHIARVRRRRERVDLVVEMHDDLSAQLRAVALAASLVADRELIAFARGGG